MVCTKCGMVGADVRPNWKEQPPRETLTCAMAKLTDEQSAALQMIAASPRGYALSTLVTHGFAFEMLQDLVRTGLLTTGRDATGPGKTKLAYGGSPIAGRSPRAIFRELYRLSHEIDAT
jgi:hypothetical protein